MREFRYAAETARVNKRAVLPMLGAAAVVIILLVLTGCVSGTQGSFEGPLCAGQPITLTFNDRTDRQEGISAGCSRTHPDGTIDEVWILTGPKTTSTVAQVDAATLGMLIGAAIEAGKRAAVR